MRYRPRLHRLPTTIAIAALVTVTILIGAIWLTALTNGHTALLSHPPTGAHGPWRHHVTLRQLDNYASLLAIFVLLPCSTLGLAIEKSRRSIVVATLSAVAVLATCAHFPLFD